MALLVSWLSHAPVARAGPRSLPRVSDGEGIKVGERSRFHPGVGLGFGLDSNVFAEDGSELPVRAANMVAAGWLGIGNRLMRDGLLDTPAEPTDRLADYNVGLILGLRQYLDRRQHVLQQSRFNVGADLHFAFLPGRRFSVDLDESVYRFADPANIESGAETNFNRVDHRGSLKFTLRPGGGRVSISTGYLTEVLWFQGNNPDLNKNDRTVNGALGEVKWRFFPRSSIYTRYTFHHTFYLSCCRTPLGVDGHGRNEDNYAHRLTGGFRGQLFKKAALGAEFGWGWGFYRQDPNGPDFKGPLAQLTLDVFPSQRTRVHLAGFRTFRDSLFANFMVDLGGRLLVSHVWRWRMITDLGASVMWREYRGIPVIGTEVANVNQYSGVRNGTNRSDVVVGVNAKIEQPLGRLFVLALMYDLSVDSTGFSTRFTNNIVNDSGFVRNLLLLFGAVRF